ncbi:DUF2971 domain-containing protein [Sphingomonas sp. PsM26]|nr:DUF2971 domain-containing protein [Sphingomonas sp. PsM26]
MNDQEVLDLFASDEMARRSRLGVNGRLVHYTSAESAYKILVSRTVWLRSASLMNDFSEISHGIDCIHGAWLSPAGARLQSLLNRLRDGLRDDFAKLFDGHANGLRNDTYLMSLSEHDDTEDELGRLSMWRAYGGNAGVALVLNVTAFASTTDAIKAYSAPVVYADRKAFISWFEDWVERLLICEDRLKLANPETVQNVLFYLFRNFAMCTKHPGFAEEREWRIFHSPLHEGTSPWLESSIEVLQGTPQQLIKLRLFDNDEAGVSGVAPRTLVERVIIGPCEHPLQIKAAIADALVHADVEDVDNKVWMSLIPLRQS